MPQPGKCWYHVTFNTYASWLPGDPRGFHSRNHRKHSSGDYHRPPRAGEHAGLHRIARQLAGTPVVIPRAWWPTVGAALLSKASRREERVLVLAVEAHHVHALAELDIVDRAANQAVARWKQHASHAVRAALPGQVWAKSADLRPVRDAEHHRATFQYIARHEQGGAWVWRYDRDAPLEALGA